MKMRLPKKPSNNRRAKTKKSELIGKFANRNLRAGDSIIVIGSSKTAGKTGKVKFVYPDCYVVELDNGNVARYRKESISYYSKPIDPSRRQ